MKLNDQSVTGYIEWDEIKYLKAPILFYEKEKSPEPDNQVSHNVRS